MSLITQEPVLKQNLQRVPITEFSHVGISILKYEVPLKNSVAGNDLSVLAHLDKEHHFTVYRAQEVISWIVLLPQDRDTAKLKNRFLCLGDDCEKIEAKVMAYIESWAAKKAFTRVFVCSSNITKVFYQNLGYKPSGETVFEAGIELHKMVKEI